MTSLADRQLTEWKAAVRKLGRLPKEWVGKTPEAMPPARVCDRILRTWGGVCYRSGVEIRPGMKWEREHVVPVSMGGMNAERNLRPILPEAHREKTKEEAKVRAKADAQRRANNGTKAQPSRPLKSRGFGKAAKKKHASRHPPLPPSRFYRGERP